MAKLIHDVEGAATREIALNKERVTLGRKASNDIQVEGANASGEHACIVTLAGDSFLEDLGSTNGTRVNGNSIQKYRLKNNDLIEIGNHRFKFVADNARADDDAEKTMVLRPRTLTAKVTPVPAPPQGFFAKLMSWFK
jgi:pSer/pThr/pTyr-binding forkhead associated (FHA) protein